MVETDHQPVKSFVVASISVALTGDTRWSHSQTHTWRKPKPFFICTTRCPNRKHMVHIPARNKSALNLLFTDAPSLVSNVQSTKGLSCTHIINIKHYINKKSSRQAPLYHKADSNRSLATVPEEYLKRTQGEIYHHQLKPDQIRHPQCHKNFTR